MHLLKSLALVGLALTVSTKGCGLEGYPKLQGYHCPASDKGCYYCSLNSEHIVVCNGHKYKFVADCGAPTCGWVGNGPACGINNKRGDRGAEAEMDGGNLA